MEKGDIAASGTSSFGDAVGPRYHAARIRSSSGEETGWHAHPVGQLISAVRGSMYVGTADRVPLLSPSMALWIPPDAPHWMRTSANNEMLYLDVNRAESAVLGSTCRVVRVTPLLRSLMIATLPVEPAARTSAHATALHRLLRWELRGAQDVPLSIVLPVDKRIRSYARAAFEDPAVIGSVEEWLADVAASRKTIERLFMAETGMPPSHWLRRARILHAIARLAEGSKISAIASDLGYESPSAFTYAFRRIVGASPSTFRKGAHETTDCDGPEKPS